MVPRRLPPSAAWVHRGLRDGFEVAFFSRRDGGHVLTGCTTAFQDGRTWTVDYEIEVDARWCTRRAVVRGRSVAGATTRSLERDDLGGWLVDGRPVPELAACVDVDLESSALTNTLPVHRLGIGSGATVQAPAAYVAADGLDVTRLEQSYTRLPDVDGQQRYAYAAPEFDFSAELRYDASLLVVSYPGIALRVR